MRNVYSNAGSPVKEIRQAVVESDGTVAVKVVGKENFQDYINSFRDSCDVQLLVSRAVNGDPDALNQRAGMYGDFTNMPKTMAEVCQKVIDGQTLFDSLDPDKRAMFDNDVFKFISQADKPDFLERLGYVPVEDVKESEKVES